MIKGISHVAVRVTDMEKSLRFYRDVLGFRESFRLMRDDGSLHLIYLQVAPGQIIELFPNAEGPSERAKCSGLAHICLEVDDIHESYRELTGRGLAASREPTLGKDRTWQFWTEDPDGTPIEFHQFTPESLQSGGKPS